MSATISFKALSAGNWVDISNSGLGFYGSGNFGASVAVGAYQDNTYITDSAGAQNGGSVNNIKYIGANSGQIPVGNTLNLLDIPNSKATINIEFSNSSAVQARNVQLVIYDRNNTANAASGVVTQVVELLHPSLTMSGLLGSGNSSWATPAGVTYLSLAQSPGTSGLMAGNGTTSVTPDVLHDWYVAMSASPSTIGSKTSYGLYISLEYL